MSTDSGIGFNSQRFIDWVLILSSCFGSIVGAVILYFTEGSHQDTLFIASDNDKAFRFTAGLILVDLLIKLLSVS